MNNEENKPTTVETSTHIETNTNEESCSNDYLDGKYQDNSPEPISTPVSEELSASSENENTRTSSEDKTNFSATNTNNEPLIKPNQQTEELGVTKEQYDKLAQKYSELERKYQELGITQEQYAELAQKYHEQNQELSSIKAQIKKLEDMSKPKFDHLIQDSLKKDSESWQEDNSEYQKYRQQGEYWQSKNECLCSGLSSIISDCVTRISQSGELIQKLTEQNILYKHLSNRYESLQLIQRMLERLREPLDKLKNQNFSSAELVKIQETDLLNLVQSQTDEKQAKILLENKLRELQNTRNQSIREWRDVSENLQKQWLHFLEKQFLPVLDGIDSGESYSQDLIAKLKQEYPSHSEDLSNWVQTYADLKETLLKALENLGVTPMKIEIGKPVDYLHHDPISTEEDSNLDQESVKEVTRHGYEYKHDLLDKVITLRSAQVVVVKNK